MIAGGPPVTRYVSFLDEPGSPFSLRLAPDQELLGEEEPAPRGDGGCRRFVFVRSPANRPISLVRQERMPDGTPLLVRYDPELDVPCAG